MRGWHAGWSMVVEITTKKKENKEKIGKSGVSFIIIIIRPKAVA